MGIASRVGAGAAAGADRRRCMASTRCTISRRSSPRWKASGTPARDRAPCCSPFPTAQLEKNHARDRDPEARELLSHPRLERRRQGPQGFSARRSAAGHSGVLRLPGDDRHVVDHAGAHRVARGGSHGASSSTRRGTVLGAATCAIPVGYVAVTAGWVTTEVGRQPYVVYGHLRTADAVTPILDRPATSIASLLAYVVGVLRSSSAPARITSFTWCGADSPPLSTPHEPKLGERPARPLSAATDHRGRADDARYRTDLDASSSASPSSCTCCSTASISASAFSSRSRPATPARDHDDQFGRADLGRQRDLAGAGRHRACSRRFRSPSPSSFRRCISRSSRCCSDSSFRGVAFEFRPTAAKSTKHYWDRSFFWGSLIATFAQGCVLGKFVLGFAVDGRQYAGTSLDWIHPFVLAGRRRRRSSATCCSARPGS